MVPQAVEAWAKHRVPIPLAALPSQRALHHIADQLMHLGYGSSMGAVYGLTLGKGSATGKKMLGFGLGVWVFGSFMLLPALKIMRPEWRAKPVDHGRELGRAPGLRGHAGAAHRRVRAAVLRASLAIPTVTRRQNRLTKCGRAWRVEMSLAAQLSQRDSLGSRAKFTGAVGLATSGPGASLFKGDSEQGGIIEQAVRQLFPSLAEKS